MKMRGYEYQVNSFINLIVSVVRLDSTAMLPVELEREEASSRIGESIPILFSWGEREPLIRTHIE